MNKHDLPGCAYYQLHKYINEARGLDAEDSMGCDFEIFFLNSSHEVFYQAEIVHFNGEYVFTIEHNLMFSGEQSKTYGFYPYDEVRQIEHSVCRGKQLEEDATD